METTNMVNVKRSLPARHLFISFVNSEEDTLTLGVFNMSLMRWCYV